MFMSNIVIKIQTLYSLKLEECVWDSWCYYLYFPTWSKNFVPFLLLQKLYERMSMIFKVKVYMKEEWRKLKKIIDEFQPLSVH